MVLHRLRPKLGGSSQTWSRRTKSMTRTVEGGLWSTRVPDRSSGLSRFRTRFPPSGSTYIHHGSPTEKGRTEAVHY